MSSIVKKIPLPFQGNKTKHIDDFMTYIKQCSANTYVDLFGGSLYLSYVVHKLKPNARVITNDYDNYRERLVNVETTNQILKKIRSIEKLKQLKYSPEESEQIREIISEFKNNNRFIDTITLSSCVCFSGNYKTNINDLLSADYFNSVPKNDYETKWYLDSLEGVEFVKMDWQELFNQYKDEPNVCFIADPPYLGTNKASYLNSYWRLKDSLNTITILKQPFFVYYTSEKSEILEFVDWLNDTFLNDKPITYQKYMIKRGGFNRSAKPWLDIMITN